MPEDLDRIHRRARKTGLTREELEGTLDRMVAMLEANVLPVVPEKGSVGASGDLAPLAHVALALIGEGDDPYRRAAQAPNPDASAELWDEAAAESSAADVKPRIRLVSAR